MIYDENCAKCGKDTKGQKYVIATLVLSLSDWDGYDWWKKEELVKKELYCEGCYQPQPRESII